MEFFTRVITAIASGSGFAALDWKTVLMLFIACVLLYMGIGKGFEPLLLVPIAFGMLLANLPITGLFNEPVYDAATHSGTVGFMWVLYQGVQYAIYPSIIFMGIGAMTDFGPLLANPVSLLLGAAAQLGIFAAFLMALVLGFKPSEAAAIGVIGGADGPTAILTASKLAVELLPAIAIAAYSYMALIPMIQPPLMKLLTTKEARQVKMSQLRKVSQTEKIIFPIAVTIFVVLLIPDTAPLIGMLMLGNLFRECGVRAPVRHRPERAHQHCHHPPGPVCGLQGHRFQLPDLPDPVHHRAGPDRLPAVHRRRPDPGRRDVYPHQG